MTNNVATTSAPMPNAHHQELTTALTASGFTIGGSNVVGRGPAGPRPTTLLPPTVKPEAVNAVVSS